MSSHVIAPNFVAAGQTFWAKVGVKKIGGARAPLPWDGAWLTP